MSRPLVARTLLLALAALALAGCVVEPGFYRPGCCYYRPGRVVYWR